MNAQAHTPARTLWPANPLAPYLALAALWLLTITIVPPRGDFPLNDDWMYAKVVKNLADTGRYEASPYADPTFILQAYWGATFVKVFGFSFETLRVSTLVLALVAIWAAHWAAREAGLNTRWAFLVALSLLVNPLFLNISYTFMTDTPFLTLSTLSGAAFLRALRTQHVRWIAIAMSITGCAMLVRQFAGVIPMAVSFILFESPSSKPVRKIFRQGAAAAVPLLIAAFLYIVLPIGGLPATEGWDWDRLGNSPQARIVEILRHLAIAFTYLALLSAAVFAAVEIPKSWFVARGRPVLKVVSYAALALLVFLLDNSKWPHRLPNLGNLLYDFGVGPLLLPGMLDGSVIAAPAHLGATLWWAITCIAIPGAAAFVALHLRASVRLAMAWSGEPKAQAELFLALWSIGLLLILVMPPVLARFDRYFVMAQVPAVILLANWLAARIERPARTAYFVAAVFWVLGIVCLQDYLAWNAARWKALDTLQTMHAAPLDQINGGYEFNGWYHSDRFAEESRRTGTKIFGPLGWWTLEDNYRVSLRPAKRFEVIGTEPYFSWLGFTKREMLLLKRTEADPLL